MPHYINPFYFSAYILVSLSLHSLEASAESLTTTAVSNNSQNGNMFNVSNTGSNLLTISGFSQNFSSGTAETIPNFHVYTRTGGLSTSAAGWTLTNSTGSFTSSPNGTLTSLSFTSPVSIPVGIGETIGLYLTTSGANNVGYTNGTLLGAVLATNSDLTIYEGYGVAYPFGSTFNPRDWNGTIFYDFISLMNTQASLQANVAALQGVYAIQTGTVNNSLNYDCTNFGSNGICFSTGGRYSNASSSNANTTSAMIIGAYKVNDELRVGGYVDQNLYNIDVANIASIHSNSPLLGVFAVWNQNANRTGIEVKLSAGHNNSDLNMNRIAIGTSELGKGTTELNAVSGSIMASYGFKVLSDWLVSPYVGFRHTSVFSSGYSEQASTEVTKPLSYNALAQESTSALIGVRLAGQVYDHTMLQTSAGFEQDIQNSEDNYTVSGLEGLTAIDFNPNIQRTRAFVSFGASYELGGSHRIGFNAIYRQESFQSVDTKMAYINYSVGL